MDTKGLDKLSGLLKGSKNWLEALHKDVINTDVDQRVVVNTLGERLLAQVRAGLNPSFEADIKRTAKALEDANASVSALQAELTHHLAASPTRREDVQAWVLKKMELEGSLPIYSQLVGPADAAHRAAIERMRSALRAALQPLADTTIDGVEHARRDAHGHTQLAVRVSEGVVAASGLIEKSERWMEA